MEFYDEKQPLHIETDASGVGLGVAYYKPEVVQAAQETRHQTTVYSDPWPLPAKVCQVWKVDTATLK